MRIATVVLVGIALSPTVEAGQQTTGRPAARVVERADVSGVALPWRLLQATNQTGDRETTIETEQMPNTDGRMVPVRETVVEVIKAGRVVRTSSETFDFAMSGQRRLLETRESIESSTEGRVQATDTTWRSDLNGRLAISERITEDASVTPDARRTERTTHRPDLDGRLRPMERREHAERRVAPQGVQVTTTESQVDVNNRWQVIEVRNRDVRSTGATEETEETILRRDLNGALSERERRVSRLTRQDGREDLLIETFTDGGVGDPFRSSIRRTLTSRIRRTTSPRADGGREIVEEVEERSLVAPEDPLRIVRRSVETARRTGWGRWEIERQLFERDPNNRLVLTSSENEETTER
jgi:hypothetical protein